MRWGGQMSGASKSVIRLGHRSGLRFGAAEGEVCWIGLEERMGMGSSKSAVQRTRPGEKAMQGGTSFRDSLYYFLSHRPSTPPLHYSTTPFPTRFPATFPAVSLCMGWRPVASPRKRRSSEYGYELSREAGETRREKQQHKT